MARGLSRNVDIRVSYLQKRPKKALGYLHPAPAREVKRRDSATAPKVNMGMRERKMATTRKTVAPT